MHVVVDEAIAVSINVAINNAPVVITGTVLGDIGRLRNLRRDSQDPSKEDSAVILPETDYSIHVNKVIKGALDPGSQIAVAVQGGSYKGKTTILHATLVPGEEYLFLLAEASELL